MSEHRVKCDICKEDFIPNPSQVRLICYGCSREGKRNQIQEFLEKLHPIEKKRLNDNISKQDICVELLNLINEYEGRLKNH